MQGLFRRATASIAVLVLLAPLRGGITIATAAPHPQPKGTIALASPPQRIPIQEPMRVKPPRMPLSGTRAKTVAGIRAHGSRVLGPPMLRPFEIDRILAAGRRRARQLPATPSAPLGRPVAGPTSPRTRPGARRAMSLPSDPTASGTGINPWWRYQEQSLPGAGRIMANVGTGNLVLQDDDMVVPHKGISFTFRRTYNSQSGHNISAADGTGFVYEPPGMYGNGWTNTFDAHIARNSTLTVYSVFDIDGTRYDYDATWPSGTNGVFTPRAGNHSTLTYDGVCGYFWTKKSGTSYYFYAPGPHAPCPQLGGTTEGFTGRLYQIVGRNRNTYIQLAYSWDNGNASLTGKISQIAVTTESGLTATLNFSDFNGHRLMDSVVYPDNTTTVSYSYDTAGNLTSSAKPANNAAGTPRTQWYGYQAIGSDSVLSSAASPRWVAGCNSACGSDGNVVYFAFGGASAATSTLTSIQHRGVVNPAINDGSGSTTLQSNYPTSDMYYRTEYYTTGVTTPTFRDSDGHMTNWVVDGSGRPTQTQECTASANQGQVCTGIWLVTNQAWDSDDNLTSSTDARGDETDYSYDASGNTTEIGEPLASTSQGTFKPTRMYDYDGHNNVVGFCDEIQTHVAGFDWNGSGTQSDSPCGSRVSAQHWHATFSYPAYEPYGQLATMVTSLGYTRAFAYNPAQQGGMDYGLATSVTGGSITQLDGTSITPTQSFWYDNSGNLRCYSKGNGTYVLSYDALGRLTSEGDPDDSSANAGSLCGKSTGQPGWNTQTTYAYFADGSKSGSQSPPERAFGVAAAYAYDADGDATTETTHHGCVSGSPCNGATSIKWYDGADRLVEVKQAPAASDVSTWLTRYLYDLSAGGTLTMSGSQSGFNAYGNLYKTQTYAATTGFSAWSDKQGSAFDALDREVKKFSYSVSETTNIGPGALETAQFLYDAGTPPTLGLLTQKTNPSGESVNFTYDSQGRVLTRTYGGDGGKTPGMTYVYDPAGRKTSATSSVFGVQGYAYDADGRLKQSTEPAGGGLTGAAQLAYSYYGNGSASAVSVTSNELTQSNIVAYSYRPDGALQTKTLSAYGGATWSKSYTDAGRLLAVSGIGTQHWAYDGTGQLITEALNSGTLTVTHDPEGSVVGETVPNIYPPSGGAPVTETLTNTLNERGELVGEQWTPNNPPVFPQQTATTSAGYLSMMSVPAPSDGSQQPCEDLADYVNDVRVDLNCPGADSQMDGQDFPQGSEDNYQFDATGRATVHTKTSSTFTSYQMPPPRDAVTVGIGTKTVTRLTTAYDAENHTVSVHPTVTRTTTRTDGAPSTGTSDGATTSIKWGPNGQPALLQLVGNSSPLTLHWDRDMILFVTDSAGSVVDFKAGLDGEVVPNDSNFTGVNSYDRDPAGVIIATNNSTGTSGMQPSDPLLPAANTAPSPGFKASGTYVRYNRSDGFQIGLAIIGIPPLQINGVRAFDATLGKWTTPDAFEGDVRDPSSQQRYMYDRGNAYDYSDPSGFDPGELMIPEGVHRPPAGIVPVNANPFSNHLDDIVMNSIGVTAGTTLLGLVADGAKLTRGGFIGALAGIVWGFATDKGIEPGYYAQTVYRDNGTVTTYAVYKAPGGSPGSFVQTINFAKNGGWEAQTLHLDTNKVERQSGQGSPRNMTQSEFVCIETCFRSHGSWWFAGR
jgi:YD repeat-containing protein